MVDSLRYSVTPIGVTDPPRRAQHIQLLESPIPTTPTHTPQKA